MKKSSACFFMIFKPFMIFMCFFWEGMASRTVLTC